MEKGLCTTVAVVALALAADAAAQSATPARPQPCSHPDSRQFEFWLGEWDVFRPDGKQIGTSRVVPLYGCGLHEHWTSPNVQGQSFNRYDASRGVWHQTWVDTSGSLLLLEGTFQDGAMTLSDARVPGKPRPDAINEIRWSRNPDGSVRQLWRVTTDGGKTWSTSFDGKYVRK
jgi:hypothetical protein